MRAKFSSTLQPEDFTPVLRESSQGTRGKKVKDTKMEQADLN